MTPKILVVDDDVSVLKFLKRVLAGGKEGELFPAATAEEALRLARTENPTVILLDLQLPDQSGLQLLRELKSIPLAAKVIVMTGAFPDDGQKIKECLRAGAFDYI